VDRPEPLVTETGGSVEEEVKIKGGPKRSTSEKTQEWSRMGYWQRGVGEKGSQDAE